MAADGSDDRHPPGAVRPGEGARPAAPSSDPGHPADASGSPPGEGITEEEAIRSLAGRIPARADSVRSRDILNQLFRRLGDDPSLSIGSLTVFNDAVTLEEGDFAVGAADRKGAPGAAPPADAVVALDSAYLKAHIGAYVRPAGFSRALDILRRRHLLVLCAPPGSGRKSAAMALLAEAGDRSRMHLVASALLLAERGWRCGPAGTTFVVPLTEADPAGRLDDVWLQATARNLSGNSNYMVIVTDRPCGALATAVSRPDFTFEELGRPDPLAVATKRARAVLGPARGGDLKVWLDRDEVATLLAEDGGPRSAARAGQQIAEALSGGKDLAATMQALLNPGRRVQEWFAKADTATGPGYQQMVLPVAVSVLEESSYLTIGDAAAALYRRLFPDQDEPPPLRFRRSLADQQQWIELIVPGEAASSYGDPAPELLRFRSPLLRATVLQYAWTWLDGMRPAMTGWMRDLAGHPDVEVRARAAASAGLLATLDFSYVLHRFVYPWAVSPSPGTRACAALALAVPGRNPLFAARVWALLREWAANAPDGPGSRLPWTAAEAAGSALGRSRPAEAVSVLGGVLNRDDWDCLAALAVAVLNLAENGCLREVLGALLEWSAAMDGSPQALKALLAFVLTARTPALAEPDSSPPEPAAAPASSPPPERVPGRSRLSGTAVAARGAGHPEPAGRPASPPSADGRRDGRDGRPDRPRHGSWPVLLAEAGSHREALRDLWGRAFAAKQVRPLALEAMRSWLELADRDAAALAPVSQVIASVIRLGGKHPERMEYYLEQWADDPKAPLRSAQRVLATIAPAAR